MKDDDDDLFSHARRSDPATSHEAVPKNISAQALRVLWGYRDGDAILDHAAYTRVGMDKTSSRLAHQRCSDLRRAGHIERTGERGRTPSGKAGYLCRITPTGLDYLAKHHWRTAEEMEF